MDLLITTELIIRHAIHLSISSLSVSYSRLAGPLERVLKSTLTYLGNCDGDPLIFQMFSKSFPGRMQSLAPHTPWGILYAGTSKGDWSLRRWLTDMEEGRQKGVYVCSLVGHLRNWRMCIHSVRHNHYKRLNSKEWHALRFVIRPFVDRGQRWQQTA